MIQAFCPLGNTYRVAPGTNAARTKLAGGSVVQILNDHATVASVVKFGGSTVEAVAANDIVLLAGQRVTFTLPSGPGNPGDHISYITASGTGSLCITTGEGGAST